MTKKIGVSLRQELYDWAAREVEEGRAESVSALIAQGLELLEARAQLEAVVTELHSEVGELDEQAKARLAEALAAADEAYRRHRDSETRRARGVRGFVFDAGAFIALERRSPLLLGILDAALHGTVEVVLPRTVIAQVWRGNPRQANVGRLISAGRAGGGPVIIDELTAGRAKQIGVTIGATSHPDIVDVHVALAAAERGHAVLTSDDGDIAGINPELILVHV